MDPVIQVVLDLIMDGSLGAVSSKKAPMAIRVIAAVILAAAFCGLVGFCFYLIIIDTSWLMKICGALILLITLLTASRFFKMFKDRSPM